MAKSCFLGLKLVQSVQEVVVDPENIFKKMIKKCHEIVPLRPNLGKVSL